MKHWIESTLANTAGQWFREDGAARRVVLCYHSVHPYKSFSSASPDLFARQMEWLRRNCEVTPFGRWSEGGKPAVAVTFDDGYEDNYEYALPILVQHHIPATFFLTLGLIQKEPAVVARFQWLQRSTEEDVQPLEWGQIREMARVGMEFGSHTWSHPNLAALDRESVRRELRVAKDLLEQKLGAPAVTLAYPFGRRTLHWTSDTVAAAAEAGYQYAGIVLYRSVRPSDPPLEIPRIVVTGDEMPAFEQKIRGAWDIVGLLQENAPPWAARLAGTQIFQNGAFASVR